MENKKDNYSLEEIVEEEYGIQYVAEEITEVIETPKQMKSEICKVVWLKDKSFAIDFKNHGISLHVEHMLDKEKIGEFIEVKYESDIGFPDFKVFPVFN